MAKGGEYNAFINFLSAAESAKKEAEEVINKISMRSRSIKSPKLVTKIQQTHHALHLQHTFGTICAARYLKNHGWTLEETAEVLGCAN